jgi:hypothetical protein
VPAAQLWWVELAQQLKQEARHAERPGSAVRFAPLPGEHHLDAHLADPCRSVDGGAFGAQLAAAREREAALAQAVSDQGLEVVFLRQELVARGVELRRAHEDAAAHSAVAERRIGALEASVRRCSSEQATKVRELEASVRALSGKSDAHAQLLEARSALQVRFGPEAEVHCTLARRRQTIKGEGEETVSAAVRRLSLQPKPPVFLL